MDGNLGLLSVHLLFDELLDVDAPLATVYLSHLSFTILEGSTNNFDGVSITNWDRAGLILCSKFFAELSGHHSSARGRGGGEICLARLSSLTANACTSQFNHR